MKLFQILAGTTSAAVVALVATGASAAEWQLNVNSALTENDPIFQGLMDFERGVEERTDGQVDVRLFSGSQLGTDEDVLEQARAGANVAVIVDGGRLAEFVPQFGILGAPYVADGFDELRVLSTSDLFQEWEEELAQASNHRVLSFNWFQGQRHMLASRPVSAPADLSGQRIRTPGAPVWMETVRAMGGTPTPMGWTEVYPALQQGVIDGAEAQHPATYGAKLYEVISDISLTGHINLITGIVASETWWQSLPQDVRQIIREEALRAGDAASAATIESLDRYEDMMREEGVTIHEIDVTPFKEATQVVYDKLGYGDLKKKVDAVIAEGAAAGQ